MSLGIYAGAAFVTLQVEESRQVMWRGEQGEARIDDNSREGNWLGGGAAM